MKEYQGQYNSCKVFNDEIEDTCIKQIYNVLNCPALELLGTSWFWKSYEQGSSKERIES